MRKPQGASSEKAQKLAQQLQALGGRLNLFKQRKKEIEKALDELEELGEGEDVEVYRFIGNSILIKKDRNKIKKSLEEELPTVKSQIKTLERQVRTGRQQLGKMLKESEKESE